MHKSIEPSILYFGTPVVLITSRNDDGSTNIAPMSSAWWLGWNCMLGLGASGHTTRNLLRERECVLNLPSSSEVAAVNRLARLTGSDPVPPHKIAMGYRHEKNKFEVSGLTPLSSEIVKPPRIEECPVQLEAVLETWHPFKHGAGQNHGAMAIEVRVVRAHIEQSILVPGTSNHIDPDKWRPLIMNFCQFYGLGERLQHSTLAEIPESKYRPAEHMAR
jgi:flavin reductase (DIM6/NTAB) family NADH-FMN oxidoreductase RutF